MRPFILKSSLMKNVFLTLSGHMVPFLNNISQKISYKKNKIDFFVLLCQNSGTSGKTKPEIFLHQLYYEPFSIIT